MYFVNDEIDNEIFVAKFVAYTLPLFLVEKNVLASREWSNHFVFYEHVVLFLLLTRRCMYIYVETNIDHL